MRGAMYAASQPAMRGRRLSIRRLAIFWRVFALDASLFVITALLLAFTPITISAPIRGSQALIILIGLIVLVTANGLLLWRAMRPLRQLAELMNSVDLLEPGKRLEIDGTGEVREVISTFNRTLTRLEAERRESSTIAFRAQESERRRIARELHDEIGQNLTGVLLFLRRAEETDGSEHRKALAEAKDTTRIAIEQLRRVDQLLRPSVLAELGLPAAVRALADMHEARTGIAVETQIDDAVAPDETVSLAVYRIAQEAFTNIARHAGCSAVSVRLQPAAGATRIELAIADDGVGIAGARFGAGLQGMRERALIVGGILRIQPGPAGGTQVTLDAPAAVVRTGPAAPA